MAFSKRKQDRRKPDARPMAASAEVCEARALLSADGACVPVDEFVETAGEDAETVESSENGLGAEDGEFLPELATCTMVPMDFDLVGDSADSVGESEIPESEEVVGVEEFVDITTVDDWDPSWAFRSFTAVVDDGAVDGEEDVKVFKGEIEEELVEAEEEFVDITTLEDWDPSWAYRGVVVDGEEEVTEIIDETDAEVTLQGWEDGLGCGVPVDGFVPEGEEFVLYALDGVVGEEGDEEPVEINEPSDGELVELTSEKEDAVEGEPEEVVTVRYLGGPNFRGGEVPEILMMSSSNSLEGSGSTAEPIVFGPLAEGGSETPAVAGNSGNVPVVIPVVSLAAAPTPLSIRITPSIVEPLFDNEEEFLEVGTLVSTADYSLESPVASEISSSAPALGESLESLSLLSGESETSDIGELTPLLDSGESAEPVTVPEAEEVAAEVEEAVSAVRPAEHEPVAVSSATGSHSQPVAAVLVAKRDRSSQVIDRFMTDFALNGFAG